MKTNGSNHSNWLVKFKLVREKGQNETIGHYNFINLAVYSNSLVYID